MMIPVPSTKLAFWRQMLYGNLLKGPAFLSNQLVIDKWAKEAINDGAMVVVIYDPRTPNGTELVAVLEENEEYAELARSVLFLLSMDLSPESNWDELAEDAALMASVFGNPDSRRIVFGSASIMQTLMSHQVAIDALMANTEASVEAFNQSIPATAIIESTLAMTTVLGSVPFRSRMFGAETATTIVITTNYWPDTITTDGAIFGDLVKQTVGWGVVLNTASQGVNGQFEDVVNSTDLMNVIFADNVSMLAMYNHQAAMNRVAINQTAMDAIVASVPGYTALFTSAIGTRTVANASVGRQTVVASADAFARLIATSIGWNEWVNVYLAMTVVVANTPRIDAAFANANARIKMLQTYESARAIGGNTTQLTKALDNSVYLNNLLNVEGCRGIASGGSSAISTIINHEDAKQRFTANKAAMQGLTMVSAMKRAIWSANNSGADQESWRRRIEASSTGSQGVAANAITSRRITWTVRETPSDAIPTQTFNLNNCFAVYLDINFGIGREWTVRDGGLRFNIFTFAASKSRSNNAYTFETITTLASYNVSVAWTSVPTSNYAEVRYTDFN